MADGYSPQSTWDTTSEWDARERSMAVAIVAPRDCGKTAYIAALRHLSTGACSIIDGAGYRLGRMVGAGKDSDPRLATEHLEEVYQNLLKRSPSHSTPNPYSYRVSLEQLRAGAVMRRDLYILDAQGGHLFPELRSELRPEGLDDDRVTLSRRLEQLELTDATQVLLVFVNEPPRLPGGLQYPVPSALSEYLHGVRFDRVIFYVACADTLFPRLGDLRHQLERYNRDVASPAAFRRYLAHFRGSPHAAFTLHFMQYLFHAGLIRTDRADGDAISFFWGSSFGVERTTGRPNMEPGPGPSVLRNADDWQPVQVLEPLLWSAGLTQTHGGSDDHRRR